MNTETGELKEFSEAVAEFLKPPWVKVKESDMTDKQKEDMQVSKYDNKSKLGKLYTNHRKLTRKQKNRQRRRLHK